MMNQEWNSLDSFQTNRVLTRSLNPLERVLTRPGDFFVPFFFIFCNSSFP